jgi:hypothetical protein
MFDKVIAEDFFQQFDQHNLLAGDTPMRYRRLVLAIACRKNYTLQNPDFCGSLVFRGFGG